MEVHKWFVTFDYEGKTHKWTISFQGDHYLPTVFQVNDEKNFFRGQLMYYTREDRWRFYYNNGDNVQELADILAAFVIKGYQ